MKSKICIALPVASIEPEYIQNLISKSLSTQPDILEFRFDYVDNENKITNELLSNILKLIDKKIPVIFTFRDYNEGGKLQINQEAQKNLLIKLVNAKPDYLDIEMNSVRDFLFDITKLANQLNIGLIYSYHDYDKTLSVRESLQIIQKFENELFENEFLKYSENSIFKIIFTAQKIEDNLVPLKICMKLAEKNKKVISFCMGELGIFSRISCIKFGSFMTYGSYEEKTAPGQLHIDQIRKIQRLLFNH